MELKKLSQDRRSYFFNSLSKEQQAIYLKYITACAKMNSSLNGRVLEHQPLVLHYKQDETLLTTLVPGLINIANLDLAIDAYGFNPASQKNTGIAQKVSTVFYGTQYKYEKIGEFNSKSSVIMPDKDPDDSFGIISRASQERNQRLDDTVKEYGLEFLHYHLIGTFPDRVVVFEPPLYYIDIETIHDVTPNFDKNVFTSISFRDQYYGYNYKVNKNILYLEINYETFYNLNPLENNVGFIDPNDKTPTLELIELYIKTYPDFMVNPNEAHLERCSKFMVKERII